MAELDFMYSVNMLRRLFFRVGGFTCKVGIASCAISLSLGCSSLHLPTVMNAVHEGRINGLPSSSKGQYFCPEPVDAKRYSEASLLQNVTITSLEGERFVCSFILGRRTSDGVWEVASGAVRDENANWNELRIGSETDTASAAPLSPIQLVQKVTVAEAEPFRDGS